MDQQQKLFLATMATKFRVRPADYVGIRDSSIAFYFDVECTEALIEHEHDQEERRLEAMSLGGFSKAMGVSGERTEVTSSNFRDQSM